MNEPVDLTVILADVAFWLTLEAGRYTGALRKRLVVMFVALWSGGHLGLAWLLPGEDLLAGYVLVLALALVLTIITREIVLSDDLPE